jgi:LysR family transcriptional regulator, regulator for bpeEF and oprC
MPMDKLRAMSFFCRAVEMKSFAAAAKAIDVPPSVVSRIIASLERELRCTLFNRSTRRLSLTEAGAAYYEQCRELLLQVEQVEAVAREGSLRPAGTLRLGYHPALRSPLVRKMEEFLASNPAVCVELTATNSPASLLDDGLDLVLRIGPIDDTSFVARRIGFTSLLTCAAPAYLARFGTPAHPRDLCEHRAIIPARRDENLFTQWSFTKGDRETETVKVPVALVLRDGVGLADLAAERAGIAQIYDTTACHYIADGRLRRVLETWSSGRQPVYAVLPSQRNTPAKVRAFLEFARSLTARHNAQ